MAIQVNRNNWKPDDVMRWRFYNSEENWEFNMHGKLANCEKQAQTDFSKTFQASYGTIEVSAWPS